MKLIGGGGGGGGGHVLLMPASTVYGARGGGAALNLNRKIVEFLFQNTHAVLYIRRNAMVKNFILSVTIPIRLCINYYSHPNSNASTVYDVVMR